MTKTRNEAARAWVLLAALLLLAQVSPGVSAPAVPVRGSIGGIIFDGTTKDIVGDVTVSARALNQEARFAAVTDTDGRYWIPDAPAGVYDFVLTAQGVDYPVRERLDVRVGMPFLLESCFSLDNGSRTASVLSECRSGFVEEARVATIGPQRFLIPADLQEQPGVATDILDVPETIQHDEIQCLTHDHFPQVDAVIQPGDAVQTSRVYFRSDKYPDYYYVEMSKENPTIDDFRAILPKPSPETERIYYYIESVDSEFDSLQTAEFDPEVIEAAECERRGAPAWFTGDDPGIVVGATTAGLAAIPPGFQAIGITGFVNSLGVLTTVGGATAAGGGALGTTGVVLVVGGGTAAAAGATIAATGENEASPP
jgi:hypothetical protein